jgi:tripartite-type tricarboxylate transporter receptor subunit TctC
MKVRTAITIALRENAMARRTVLICGIAPILLLAGLALGVPAIAHVQGWPQSQPIKIEVISAAGGLTDIVPRELADPLSASLGVPIIVEDRPGAGGNIAAGIVAKADPDGHTLLVTGSNQAVNPTLLPNPGFDYERDLVPVSMVVVAKMLLVASPSSPAKTIGDVIRLAKQKPKSVSIAISPIGTPNHLGAEMLAQYGDIDVTFVPYGGIGQAIPDLIAGRIDLAVGAMPSLLPQVRSGALKALAVTSAHRTPLAPDIPTSAEAGLPDLLIDAWICFLGTGGTPAPIVARLDHEFAKAVARPNIQEAFAKQGIEPFYMDSQQLALFLHSEAERFSGLLKHTRVKTTSD